ncbi:hypothetical protein C5167_041404 [Papaver somniferum]|nr:hypothetical protein C5167_041404 [Papaver somniferum]
MAMVTKVYYIKFIKNGFYFRWIVHQEWVNVMVEDAILNADFRFLILHYSMAFPKTGDSLASLWMLTSKSFVLFIGIVMG